MLFFGNVEYIWTIPRPQTCISMQDSGLQAIATVNLLLVLTRILTGDIKVRSVITWDRKVRKNEGTIIRIGYVEGFLGWLVKFYFLTLVLDMRMSAI